MALPAIRAIRSSHNGLEDKVVILGRSYVADIYRDQNVADELIVYDNRGSHSGVAGRERLASELLAQKFDVAILLQNAFDAAWLAWRAGIPELIGYARDGWYGEVPLARGYEGLPIGEHLLQRGIVRRAGQEHQQRGMARACWGI